MTRRPLMLACALVLSLAACGQRGELRLQPGQASPPPPFGREQSLSTEALLTPPPEAMPERSVELRTRSQEREDDPFNLPPQE